MRNGLLLRRSICLAVCLGAVLASGAPVQAQPTYSGALNVLPSQAPWNWGYQALNLSNPLTAPLATATAGGGVTTLDTMGQVADAAGFTTHVPNLFSPGLAYVHPNLIALDRSAGFQVNFTLKVLDEQHSNADRAGFSVTVLSSLDLPLGPPGIELAFWKNEVWAQNAGFTHGESSGPFDTTTGLIPYQLQVAGDSYTLLANNVQILSGSLRDYSGFKGGPPFNPNFPYYQTNFVFFGDDTSSAQASVQIASFQVVPEPMSVVLAAVGGAILIVSLSRKRISQSSPNSRPTPSGYVTGH